MIAAENTDELAVAKRVAGAMAGLRDNVPGASAAANALLKKIRTVARDAEGVDDIQNTVAKFYTSLSKELAAAIAEAREGDRVLGTKNGPRAANRREPPTGKPALARVVLGRFTAPDTPTPQSVHTRLFRTEGKMGFVDVEKAQREANKTNKKSAVSVLLNNMVREITAAVGTRRECAGTLGEPVAAPAYSSDIITAPTKKGANGAILPSGWTVYRIKTPTISDAIAFRYAPPHTGEPAFAYSISPRHYLVVLSVNFFAAAEFEAAFATRSGPNGGQLLCSGGNLHTDAIAVVIDDSPASVTVANTVLSDISNSPLGWHTNKNAVISLAAVAAGYARVSIQTSSIVRISATSERGLERTIVETTRAVAGEGVLGPAMSLRLGVVGLTETEWRIFARVAVNAGYTFPVFHLGHVEMRNPVDGAIADAARMSQNLPLTAFTTASGIRAVANALESIVSAYDRIFIHEIMPAVPAILSFTDNTSTPLYGLLDGTGKKTAQSVETGGRLAFRTLTRGTSTPNIDTDLIAVAKHNTATGAPPFIPNIMIASDGGVFWIEVSDALALFILFFEATAAAEESSIEHEDGSIQFSERLHSVLHTGLTRAAKIEFGAAETRVAVSIETGYAGLNDAEVWANTVGGDRVTIRKALETAGPRDPTAAGYLISAANSLAAAILLDPKDILDAPAFEISYVEPDRKQPRKQKTR